MNHHGPRPAVGHYCQHTGTLGKPQLRRAILPHQTGELASGSVSVQPPMCVMSNTFDRFNPVTPPWLAQLHEEWVKPTKCLDLWREDWKTSFAPLYAEAPKWQRLWPDGQGTPQRGCFVRGGLMFRTGCYCGRLCVPCFEARIKFVRGSHDSALAGHNGVDKTAC